MGGPCRTANTVWPFGEGLEFFTHTVTQIHSVLGRLMSLASLRDSAGDYHDGVLIALFPAPTVNQCLRFLHRLTFSEWMRFNQDLRSADLENYLSGGDMDRTTILCLLATPELQRRLVPPGSGETSEHPFTSELANMAQRQVQYASRK